MNKEISIPEFMNKPKEYITMTQEEYDDDRRFIVHAVQRQCQQEYLKRGFCILLLAVLGISYVAWRISVLPEGPLKQFPGSESIEYKSVH